MLRALIHAPGIKEHSHHPYPTEQEKVDMMEKTGMNLKQINNWYVLVHDYCLENVTISYKFRRFIDFRMSKSNLTNLILGSSTRDEDTCQNLRIRIWSSNHNDFEQLFPQQQKKKIELQKINFLPISRSQASSKLLPVVTCTCTIIFKIKWKFCVLFVLRSSAVNFGLPQGRLFRHNQSYLNSLLRQSSFCT